MQEIITEQGTDEWLEIRKAKITGTKLKNVMMKNTTAGYKNLMYELIAEQFAPQKEFFQSEAMQRGIILESEAIKKYTEKTGVDIEEVGFCISDKFDFLGLSPDGMTKDRLHAVEVKCPDSHTHAKYISENKIPPEYKWQIVNYFLVNENLETLDFISYDDRFFREDLKLHIVKVKRDDFVKDLQKAEEKILAFRSEWEKNLYNFI